ESLTVRPSVLVNATSGNSWPSASCDSATASSALLAAAEGTAGRAASRAIAIASGQLGLVMTSSCDRPPSPHRPELGEVLPVHEVVEDEGREEDCDQNVRTRQLPRARAAIARDRIADLALRH